MAPDGSIRFSVDLDHSDLEKSLKNTERKIESLKNKIEEQTIERNVYAEKMDEAAAKADAARARVKQLQNAIVDAQQVKAGSMDMAETANADAAIARYQEQLKEAETELATHTKETDALWQKWEKIGFQLDIDKAKLESKTAIYAEIRGELDKIETTNQKSTTVRLQERIAEAGKKAAESIRTAHQKASGSMEAGYKRVGVTLRTALRTVIPFTSIALTLRQAFRSMKEFITATGAAKSAIDGLKAAVKGFVGGIVQMAMPAIMGFIRVVTTMVMTLARLIDSIFKTDFVGAIRNQIASANAAAAQSSEDAASKANKQAKSLDKLGKAAKEAKNQLMGFDELNILNEDKDDDKLDDLGDSLGDSGGGSEGFVPATLIEGIDAALAQIMLIAGAAILAIGLILVFSGANIPLGLALIVVGALMIYTAVAEQWDLLPEQIQQTLLGILMIIGAALIVVGIILVCTGNLALGIAFIIAGAAMFVVAALIDPDMMISMVQSMKDHILGIIGAALLVIGIILCVAGVSLPIGIMLVAAGALLLVAEAVLHWNEMSDETQKFVLKMMQIIGAALIVIGILLIVTGFGIALGIAAIVAGIIILVSEAALNHNLTSEMVKDFFAKLVPVLATMLVIIGIILCVTGVGLALGIAAIVAGIGLLSVAEEKLNMDFVPDEVEAFMDGLLSFIKSNAQYMLVLGILLCLTGVMLPLGIGLIIAGVVGMVLPEDVDFGAIKDKIREVWDGIVAWWDANVADIFTIEWWQNLFSCIGEGIWNALTSIGGTLGSFFGQVGEGIGGILGGLGQAFSWVIPSFDLPVPHLATGAVIPANREFLAVLGDQSHGPHLEAPESLIRQIVREEAGAGAGVENVLYQILDAIRDGSTLVCDGEVLGRIAQQEQASRLRMAGWQ